MLKTGTKVIMNNVEGVVYKTASSIGFNSKREYLIRVSEEAITGNNENNDR